MTVISWYRTEEFYFIKFTPWSVSHYAVSHGTCDAVEHDIQVWVSVDDEVVRILLQTFRREDVWLPGFHRWHRSYGSLRLFRISGLSRWFNTSIRFMERSSWSAAGFPRDMSRANPCALISAYSLSSCAFSASSSSFAHVAVFFHNIPPCSAMDGTWWFRIGQSFVFPVATIFMLFTF